MHLFDVHRNTFAEENKGVKLNKEDSYDANVKVVDKLLSNVIEKLKALQVLEKTIVVIMADHGECLGEGGRNTHGFTLLDIEFGIPLIIAGPGIKQKRIKQMCRSIDVVPTILDLLKIVPKIKPDGISLINNKEEIDEVYLEGCLTFLEIRGIRTKKWKYIIERNKDETLYDLSKDPEETKNVIEQNKGIANQLRERVKNHFAKKSREQETDEHTKEMLRNLGYLD